MVWSKKHADVAKNCQKESNITLLSDRPAVRIRPETPKEAGQLFRLTCCFFDAISILHGTIIYQMSRGTALVDNFFIACYAIIILCMTDDFFAQHPHSAGEYMHIVDRGIEK